MTPSPSSAQKIGLYAGLGYLAFIIYGSLVPLEFRDRSWGDALQAFARIPFLQLGIGSRADWIANILLYMPLTFIWSGIVGRNKNHGVRIFAQLAVLAAAIVLAIAIEFTQLFFPQRTVSLNDMLAETIGSVAGLLLWYALGARVTGWLSDLRRGGITALAAALSLYLLAYLGLSLFPFDFVLSTAELAAKLAEGKYGWLFAESGCSSGSRCMVKLVVEMLAVAPLGIMLAQLRTSSRKTARTSSIAVAALAGAVLGLIIESAQLFLNSGIAEGVSVLVRSIGTALGAYAYQHFLAHRAVPVIHFLHRSRWLIFFLAPLYLAGLAVMQNWRMHTWLSWELGWARLPHIHFLPFYYHYFTTETAALVSVWFTSVAYAPIGILLFWAHGAMRRQGLLTAALLAALIAAAFEFAKLFQKQTHPDPTNVLIAASAAAAAYALMCWAGRLYTQPPPPAQPELTAAVAVPPPQTQPASAHGRISWLALVAAAMLAWFVIRYPLNSILLCGGLLAYLAVLRRWPQAWLLVLPALLPVLDLTSWSGRIFFDEFDALLLATVAIAGWRSRIEKSSYRLSPAAFVVLALFTLSTMLALALGAYPYAAFDLNSFNNYYSPYNALRIGKGLLWALLLLPLLKNALEQHAAKTHRLFALGMTLGVLAAGVAVLWERLAFTGLLDFSNGYRVVGMFSGMHTGGAYIEGYFATALPLVAWWTLTSPRWSSRAFGAGVFVLGCYGLMVTYARGGTVALALGMTVLVAGMLLGKSSTFKSWHAIGAAALLMLLAAVAWPVLQGSVMQERFSTTQKDANIRSSHWQDALRMMDDGISTTLFGMGLGRYPHTYFWRNTEGVRPANYSFNKEANNTYLSISPGDTLYFEQLVAVQPNTKYRVSFIANSRSDKEQLTMPLCEKWMLYAADCIWNSVIVNGQWQRYTLDFDTRKFAARPWYAQRSVKLSFFNSGTGTALGIAQISMRSADGKELLKNGDFTLGMDHWFFTTDNHLPWHFKNLWLQIYFEQGALGLLLFSSLLLYAGIVLFQRHRAQDAPMAALAAALTGFLTVGVVDSLFDVPRMALLFYLLLALIMLRNAPRIKIRRNKIT